MRLMSYHSNVIALSWYSSMLRILFMSPHALFFIPLVENWSRIYVLVNWCNIHSGNKMVIFVGDRCVNCAFFLTLLHWRRCKYFDEFIHICPWVVCTVFLTEGFVSSVCSFIYTANKFLFWGYFVALDCLVCTYFNQFVWCDAMLYLDIHAIAYQALYLWFQSIILFPLQQWILLCLKESAIALKKSNFWWNFWWQRRWFIPLTIRNAYISTNFKN